MDLTRRHHPNWFPGRVAGYARAYLDMMVEYPHLGDILVWGLCDRYSWLQARWPRADRLANRPCPYDADFRPKPFRESIAAGLDRADGLPDRMQE